MIIEFETTELIDEDFSNNKPSAKEGSRWYTRKQPCLMFKDNSKYPDKFLLSLVFSSSKEDQQAVSAFAVGQYELTDQAHGFDNRRNPICDYTKIKPLSKK
jgi:hypothetical protein